MPAFSPVRSSAHGASRIEHAEHVAASAVGLGVCGRDDGQLAPVAMARGTPATAASSWDSLCALLAPSQPDAPPGSNFGPALPGKKRNKSERQCNAFVWDFGGAAGTRLPGRTAAASGPRDGRRGPVCPVVWEGRHREVPPYPDQSPFRPALRHPASTSRRGRLLARRCNPVARSNSRTARPSAKLSARHLNPSC